MSDKPLWRTVVERIDDLVEPGLLKAVEDERFAGAAGIAYQVRHGVTRQVERLSTHALHLLNLPTRTDVNRVLAHVSALQHDLQALQERVPPTTRGGQRGESDVP
jgi:hypothetical protein